MIACHISWSKPYVTICVVLHITTLEHTKYVDEDDEVVVVSAAVSSSSSSSSSSSGNSSS